MIVAFDKRNTYLADFGIAARNTITNCNRKATHVPLRNLEFYVLVKLVFSSCKMQRHIYPSEI